MFNRYVSNMKGIISVQWSYPVARQADYCHCAAVNKQIKFSLLSNNTVGISASYIFPFIYLATTCTTVLEGNVFSRVCPCGHYLDLFKHFRFKTHQFQSPYPQEDPWPWLWFYQTFQNLFCWTTTMGRFAAKTATVTNETVPCFNIGWSRCINFR